MYVCMYVSVGLARALEELPSQLKMKEAELSSYLSFSSSEDLILLKSTFLETQGRRLCNFLCEYKPLTLRLSYGFVSILSGAATPISALTRHKILLLQLVRLCKRHFTERLFQLDTATEWRRFTFCSKSCSSDKPRNALRNASESNLSHKSDYQLQELIYTVAEHGCSPHIKVAT